MSIRARFEDAHFLLANGRFDGALLNILVAIAATSRKRYPSGSGVNDRTAFNTFMHDELIVFTHGAIAENFELRVPGADKRHYPDEVMRVEDLFYTYVRCALAHEGALPANVRFKQAESGAFSQDIQEDYIELSTTYFDGLAKVVQFARENTDEFPEHKELPDDVLSWLLFGARRENEKHKRYIDDRRKHLAV